MSKADSRGDPLSKKRDARDQLAKKHCMSYLLAGFPIFARKLDNTCIVINEISAKNEALIIHRRFIINPYLTGDYLLVICIEWACACFKYKYDIGKR